MNIFAFSENCTQISGCNNLKSGQKLCANQKYQIDLGFYKIILSSDEVGLIGLLLMLLGLTTFILMVLLVSFGDMLAIKENKRYGEWKRRLKCKKIKYKSVNRETLAN